MTGREMIFGVVGLLLGAGAGVLSTRKYYQKKCVDEINKELENKYWADEKKQYSDMVDGYSSDKNDDKPSVSKVSYKEYYDEKKAANGTDYQGMYRAKKLAEDAANAESEDDKPIDNGDESYEEYDHAKNKNRPPMRIRPEDVGDVDNYYDHVELFYYTYDDILTDEDENVIEDRLRIVGDCLDKYGFNDDDDDTMFVQNFELSTVYEIAKVDAAFQDQQYEEDE